MKNAGVKNHSRKFLIFLVIAFAQIPAFAQASLESLYRGRQYFDLREALEKRAKDDSPGLLFYRGVAANRFNRLEESIRFLREYLRGGAAAGNAREAYETLADDYVRTYDYGRAADVYKILLGRFEGKVDAEKTDDYKNSFGLWDALRGAARQEISFGGDSHIRGTRDKADLLNLPAEINSRKMNFVFDTGANLSTMTVSTASKLGLKIIESAVSVGSSSDIKVTSKLAVAPSLKLGNAVLRNVVFLVLDDKALFFPQINYQIDGIVGFPVIEALGSLTISRENEVTVKAAGEKNAAAPNMCLEDLKPLVAARVGDKKMVFLLDSGAVTSTFYPPFFRANKGRILKLGAPRKIKLGGAGGSKEVAAYFLKNLSLTIAGKTARFARAEIITEPVNEESRNFYGNLGQDLIKQFARMTLDFRAMRIAFE